MIPYQITLQNFLSYGAHPQTIVFEGYHLICLSGKNGHGKSALLDAMTWAVWGQARKTTGVGKPDEGLLRLGARSMMVVFEFYISGDLYRIRREFSIRQGSKHVTTLDIAVFDSDADAFKSLTEKTIRGTQAVIESVVGLDYETYTNSAFFRQGNANAFSQKSPKDRKRILTSILGVDRYDALQQHALEQARTYGEQKAIVEQFIASDEQEVAGYSELAVRGEECAAQRTACDAQYEIAEKQLQVAMRAHEQFSLRKKEYERRVAEHSARKNGYEQATGTWLDRASTYRKALHALNHTTKDVASSEQRAEWEKEASHLRSLQQEEVAYERQAIEIERTLSAEIQARKELFEEKKKGYDSEALNAQRVFEQAELAVQHASKQSEACEKELADLASKKQACVDQSTLIAAQCAQGAALEARFEKRKTFYTTYVPRLKWLEQESTELSGRIAMVEENGEGACPLCEQLLTQKRRQFLVDRLKKQLHRLNHQKKRLHTILSELKELLVQDHAAMNELQAVRTQESQLKVQVEALDEQISALTTKAQMSGEEKKIACASHEQARTVLEQKKAACAAYEKQQEAFLAEGEKVQSLTAALADIEKKRRESLYDAKRHQELEHALAQASADDAARAAALEQRNQLERERSALHERWKMLVQERSAIASEATTIEQSALDASIEDELTAAVVQEKERCSDLRKKKDDLTQEQGQLSAALARIESRRVAIKERQKEVAELSQKQHDCSVLAGAWGKNGIQALLIEQAIPEIEQEANELLGRLSNNQTQIFIESLRDLKRGGARETLDIKISDTSGVRPYEMFSGGEAFRIDFALRIAISKLLCRRAGASLQVLIIDEGFGSQDEEGLARLMQALYAVDDEFAKIIVVSHLPYFKDNFPVHFLVEKGPAGSTVSVDERG